MDFTRDESDTPNVFTTIEEARDSLNQTVNSLFGVFYSFDVERPYSAHLEAFPLHAKYTMELADWNKAFERFMQTDSSMLTSKEIRGAAMLKMQHMTVTIMASTTVPDANDPRPIDEILTQPELFAPYNQDFASIIKLSRSLIVASEADAKSGMTPLNFSADLGLIGPLYYCSVKPTDHTLRKAALELLNRCQRREGMWDSSSLVAIVQGFWQIESQYEALQSVILGENGEPVSLAHLLDLYFDDGMQWEWKWRETVDTDRSGVSQDTWARVLSDGRIASIRKGDRVPIYRS